MKKVNLICIGCPLGCPLEVEMEGNEVLTVTERDAYLAAQRLAKNEGILCGISSGAALHIATELALREENKNKTIVALLPDTGDRYLSTELFK